MVDDDPPHQLVLRQQLDDDVVDDLLTQDVPPGGEAAHVRTGGDLVALEAVAVVGVDLVAVAVSPAEDRLQPAGGHVVHRGGDQSRRARPDEVHRQRLHRLAGSRHAEDDGETMSSNPGCWPLSADAVAGRRSGRARGEHVVRAVWRRRRDSPRHGPSGYWSGRRRAVLIKARRAAPSRAALPLRSARRQRRVSRWAERRRWPRFTANQSRAPEEGGAKGARTHGIGTTSIAKSESGGRRRHAGGAGGHRPSRPPEKSRDPAAAGAAPCPLPLIPYPLIP